ncbi:DUF2515 family protein [Peribacillus sp. SCS-37]|uniref:DUF2515 family protein n=1 Tax=Paraperibacillus esterisolvens TaxID=3115296 RepID=UPI003906578C
MAFTPGFKPNQDEDSIIALIRHLTVMKNTDNISRTKAYARFFYMHPEIKWAFLASMVSRNAGWNMCDLEGIWLPRALPVEYRCRLFLTYERANWLIFDDAFPGLLLYHYSTINKRPMFHLCPFFNISDFMKNEWECFWEKGDEQRLLYSLIINEQNLIHTPVMKQKFYRNWVFSSGGFLLQDRMHFSTVLFPTRSGKLYGLSVNHFKNLDARIDLGKNLAAILFDSGLFNKFLKFSITTEHTGSRHDYERFFPYEKRRETPFLRKVYPVISHHRRESENWDQKRGVKQSWFEEAGNPEIKELTGWYKKKQKQLEAAAVLFNLFLK